MYRINNKLFKSFRFISLGLVFFTIVLTIVAFSKSVYGYDSLWEGASFTKGRNEVAYAVAIFLFVLGNLNLILGFFATFKKHNVLMVLYLSINLFVHILFTILLGAATKGLVFIILDIILSIAAIVIGMLHITKNRIIVDEDLVINNSIPKLAILILAIIGLVFFFVMLFIPVISKITTEGSKVIFSKIIIFNGVKTDADIYNKILFIVYLLFFIPISIYFINSIMYYRNYDKIFAEKINKLINVYFAFGLIIFIACYFLSIIIENHSLVFGSYLPFITMTIIKILYSVFRGKYFVLDEDESHNQLAYTIEPSIYQAIITIISSGILFIKVIEVEYKYLENTTMTSFSGLDLLRTYKELGSGYQVLAFFVLAVIIISIVLLVLSLCAFFAKFKDYYKLTKTGIYANVILLSILGLSSFYFKIAQKINEENILSILGSMGINIAFENVNDIRSQMFFLAIPAIAVLIVAIFRGVLIAPEDRLVAILGDDNNELSRNNEANKTPIIESSVTKDVEDFDACPVFTELDTKKEQYDLELKAKEKFTFENPTLSSLVNFIVDYACESRLHLSYKKEDIATFIAGLGASRLTILQGMSGTGKTSLPKIFCEAIFGNCEIIEVESSWRDKNELLGYYNEFSKIYSPKKFTQKLYKAKLNPNIITFIVLDEMNLSRIEYYFSDFLSLMENEEDKREIKLLNVKLERTINNEKHGYFALEEGHTIKIPTNVWFIGTANRDESTFEISDKVYDRAQTMNFNKRAPKARPEGRTVAQKYLSYEEFSILLNDAKNKGTFEAEDNEIIKEVEKILQPFNISFGNRVLKQIEEFVNIYCACFGNNSDVLNEAIENILLSKVVAKLEFKNIENKEKLVKQFNKLNLTKCSEFVSRLNED